MTDQPECPVCGRPAAVVADNWHTGEPQSFALQHITCVHTLQMRWEASQRAHGKTMAELRELRERTCETCRHRGDTLYLGHYECQGIPHSLYECQDETAVVQDFEDYGAVLHVRDDFACNRWEAKP